MDFSDCEYVEYVTKKVKKNKLNIIVVEEVGNGLIKTINIEEIKKYLG